MPNADSTRFQGTARLSVSVPGAVEAWVDALERFGTLPCDELLAPAIGYARDGFPVSTRLASDIAASAGALNDHARALFLPGGQPPAVGTLLRNPALAVTLEQIAKDGKDGFYRGPVAERLSAFLEAEGGYLRAPDLAGPIRPPGWNRPGATTRTSPCSFSRPTRRGSPSCNFFEMAKGFDLKEMGRSSAEYLHTLIEMKKLAFADRDQWAADPHVRPRTPVSHYYPFFTETE